MNQKDKCIRFCENIKQAQLVRFQEAGFSEEEANELWYHYKRDYLATWREYVVQGLASLPKELKKILPKVVNEFIRSN